MEHRGQEGTVEIRGADTVHSGPPGFRHWGSDPPRPRGAVRLGRVTCCTGDSRGSFRGSWD